MGRRASMANRYGRSTPIFNDDGAIVGYEDDPLYLMTRGWSRNFNERARGPSAFAKSSPALAESIARAKSAEHHSMQRTWLKSRLGWGKTSRLNSHLEEAIHSEKGVDAYLDALIKINTKFSSSAVKRERQARELAESSGMSIDEARDVIATERMFEANELNERRGRERRKAELDALREEYDESEERKSASRKARRKSDLQGYMAYKRDMFMAGLDDREQFAYEHGKEYGRGAKGRERAREVWDKQVLEQFKWLKPLAKNSTLINKSLPFIAANMKTLVKIPIIGQFIKNPSLAAPIAAAAIIKSAWQGYQENAKTAFGIERSGVSAATGMSADYVLSQYGEGGGKNIQDFVRNFKSKMGALRHGGSPEFLSDLARYGIDARGKSAFGVMSAITQQIHDLESQGRSDEAIALADQFNIGPEVFAAIHAGHYGDDFLKFINKETEHYAPRVTSTKKATGTVFDRIGSYWSRATKEFSVDLIDLLTLDFLFNSSSTGGGVSADKMGAAATAAEALSAAESAAIDSGSMVASVSGDTFHIENVNVNNPKDAMDIVNQLKGMGSGRTLTASLETLASMDSAFV